MTRRTWAHIPPWGYETQPPYLLGVFRGAQMDQAAAPLAFDSVLAAMLHIKKLYLPPGEGTTVALLDQLDQQVFSYQKLEGHVVFNGCNEGLQALSTIDEWWAFEWNAQGVPQTW